MATAKKTTAKAAAKQAAKPATKPTAAPAPAVNPVEPPAPPPVADALPDAEPIAAASSDGVFLRIDGARALPEVASGKPAKFAEGSVEVFVGNDGRVMKVVRTADGLAQTPLKG
jgi:hypothetical protein